jgi:cytochrome c-L
MQRGFSPISRRCAALVALLVVASPWGFAAQKQAPVQVQSSPPPPPFVHTFSGEPLVVEKQPFETLTKAAERFLRDRTNVYVNRHEPVKTGGLLYLTHCAICHGVDGKGRMAPSLADETYVYPKNSTDQGLFETLYGGAGGAMTGFAGRLTLDEMLRIMAYVRSLQSPSAR